MKKYDKKSADQKREEIENNVQELLKNTLKEYHSNPELFAEAFAFSCNFYQYSPLNTQLIYAQNKGATYCQSYSAWKKMGYNVLSGQHGLKVRIPIHTTWLKINNEEFVKLSEATAAQKEAYQKGMIEGFEKLSFGIGNVFDISQTDFPKDQYPKLFNMGYPSAQHLNICRGIEDFATEQLHCPVLQSNLKSISLRGVYLPEINVIKINERLEDTQRLCTTLHELGHALIHSEKLSRNKPVSQKELEAEALSIMIQANYGLELTEARKMHFKNHYDSFIETLKGTDKDPFTEIDSIFKSVFHSYKEHIESINDYVFNRINLNIENHHSLQQNLNDKSLHIKQSKHQKISIDR